MTRTSVAVTFGAIPARLRDDPRGVYDLIVYEVMQDVTQYTANRLAKNTPSGASGIAWRSIVPSVSRSLGGQWEGHVDYIEPAASYIGFVNDGTRPHWPPFEPIHLWATRVLGDPSATGRIRAAIARRGTKPQRFVEKTVDTLGPDLSRVADMAVSRAVARL